ncbi:hypothetical protein PENTCL1PPCAC_2570, partial [Pristionchus entomophagus]
MNASENTSTAQHSGLKAWIEIKKNTCFGEIQTLDALAVDSSKVHRLDTRNYKHFRCRENRPVSANCDPNLYFEQKQCEFNKKCTPPQLNKINANKVECSSGSLQAFFDDWAATRNNYEVECNANKNIVMKKPSGVTDGSDAAYEPQLLRCWQDAVCEIDPNNIIDLSDCDAPDHCVLVTIPPSPSNTKFTCADKYKIEGREIVSRQWTAFESVMCYNDNKFPKISGQPQIDKVNGKKYDNLRCRRQGVCDLANYGSTKAELVSTCGSDNECDQPTLVVNTNLQCPDKNYELQAT